MNSEYFSEPASLYTVATTTTHKNLFHKRSLRVLQNYLLVWLDPNLDERNEDFKQSKEQLQNIVASITTFTNVEECIDFISDIKDESVFMIVADSMMYQLIFVIEIHRWFQIDSIYIVSDDPFSYEAWKHDFPKIKGAYSEIEDICYELKDECKHCDESMISMSFNRIDPLFVYTQLLKEALIEIEDDDAKSIKAFVQYCRAQQDFTSYQIDLFEVHYNKHSAVWWYTSPYFIYPLLNRGLRLLDVDILLKMAFFIRHLHQQIEKLHHEQKHTKTIPSVPFQVFRGQSLSRNELEKMKTSIGGLMSFNSFLSTSLNLLVSRAYAHGAAYCDSSHMVGIVFTINIDPKLCEASITPFCRVSSIGYFKDSEEEILFSTHAIFRIDRIQRTKDRYVEMLWEVQLTFVGNSNYQMQTLLPHLRHQLSNISGWLRVIRIFQLLNEPSKAVDLYTKLHENSSFHHQITSYINQSGLLYNAMSKNTNPVSSYERSTEKQTTSFPLNPVEIASTYNNIASIYDYMGLYSEALTFYKRALKAMKTVLCPSHPDFTAVYKNIASVYDNMGKYSRALSYYKRAVEIMTINLPENHPSLVPFYNNLGMLYAILHDYSKSLSYYKQSLKIRTIALPPNHSDLGISYNNIGFVYENMNNYTEALSNYRQSLEIMNITLPSNHPDLATSYNNIASVYTHMGLYSEALSFYERSLKIRDIALPQNHHDFAISYNNIASVYHCMGLYSTAVSFYERSLQIIEIAVPSNDSMLVASCNKIASLYKEMGEYYKALPYYERALKIRENVVPSNASDFINSYNHIATMDNYMVK